MFSPDPVGSAENPSWDKSESQMNSLSFSEIQSENGQGGLRGHSLGSEVDLDVDACSVTPQILVVGFQNSIV
jgi:hypothetical protein